MDIVEMLRPHVKNAAALMKNVQSDDAGAIQITEDFVQARVPPPMRPEDIPPPRKSGRPRAVQFM